MKILKILSILIIIISVVSCVVTNVHPTPYPVDKSGIEEDSGIMFGAIDPTDMPVGGTWAAVRAAIDENFDNVNGTLDSIETTLTEYGDSITNYSSDIQLRLLISDTTSMLGNYTRNGELASALVGYVAVTDTATMLMNYALTSELGDAGTSIGDVRDEIADSLNFLRPLYVAVADTAAMLDTYAKLSDIAEGGISLAAVQEEIADSLNLMRIFLPATFIQVEDSTGISPYSYVTGYQKSELEQNISGRVAYGDTASMLTNYALLSEIASETTIIHNYFETRVDSIVAVLADSVNIETILQVNLDTDTLATKAYARLVGGGGGGVVGITLNSGTITLNGSEGTADDITFYTNGDGSYDLPSGGGNLTIMSQVQGWINDSLDVFRPLYLEVADTASMLTNYALLSEVAASYVTETNLTDSLDLIREMIIDSLLLRSEPIFVFGAGGGSPGDTATFSGDGFPVLGSFNTGRDTLMITQVIGQLWDINTTDTLAVQIMYADSLNQTSFTTVWSSPIGINSDGLNSTSFASPKIPPRKWVWSRVASVVVGRKPTMINMELFGYRIKAY